MLERIKKNAIGIILLAVFAGCAHIDAGREKVEHVGERPTGRVRAETVGHPQIRVISRPTAAAPELRLAFVQRRTLEREYVPQYEEVRYSAPWSIDEEMDEQCWGCLFVPVNIGKAFVFFLFPGFWKRTYERYAPYVNINPEHYPEREVLKTIEGAPFWKKEAKDEFLPPPEALITLGRLPFPPALITVTDNAIILDLTEQVRNEHGAPWEIRLAAESLPGPFSYSPTPEEREAFEYKFGLENVLDNSSDSEKMRRFAGRALDGEKPGLAVRLLDRAVKFEDDVASLLNIGMLAAPYCASIVRQAVEKTGLEIPGSVEADTLLVLGGALSDDRKYDMGGDLLDIVEDRDPLNDVTTRALIFSAKKDMLRAVTYAHTMNRLNPPEEKPGNVFLLGYTVMESFANIDIKLSILKKPPPEAAQKWDEALTFFRAGSYENAAEAFGQILIGGKYPHEVANNRAICYWRLAEAAFAENDLASARSHVRKMVEICPVIPELDKTMSRFFVATAIAELARPDGDLHAAARDLRTSVRLEHRRESLAGLVTALWRSRKLGAAERWAKACSALEKRSVFAAHMAAFTEKVRMRDFPAAGNELEKLKESATEGNESTLVGMFAHELEWEKYIAGQAAKGKTYSEIAADVEKYRSTSDAYRKAAGRLKGKLPESK